VSDARYRYHSHGAVPVEHGGILSSQTSCILAWITRTDADHAELLLLSSCDRPGSSLAGHQTHECLMGLSRAEDSAVSRDPG
jgi:hypothetical protein